MSVMRGSRARSVAFTVAILLIATAPAWGQLNILSGQPLKSIGDAGLAGASGPESVVSVSSQFTPGDHGQPGTLSVTATIAPPWHTYAITQKPTIASPTEIKVAASPDYRLVGEFRPNLPPKAVHDALGDLEIHEGTVVWQAPLEIKPGVDPKTLKISGQARIQVCDDKSCLSPTNFEFAAAYVPPEPAAARPAATGVYSPANIHAVLRGHLEPSTVAPGSTVKLVVTAEPQAGWHIYALADRDANTPGSKPTLVTFTKTSGFEAERTQASQKAVEAKSDLPGVPAQHYYNGPVTWTTTIRIPKDTRPATYPIEGLVGYQTCNDANCDLPRAARFSAAVTVAAAGGKEKALLAFSDAKYGEAAKAAEADTRRDDGTRTSGGAPGLSLWLALLSSLVGGFLLNFMPCVLPVIGLKILSFAEQAGRHRSQVLALNIWYSLGLLSVFMVLATLASAASLGLRDTNLGWGEQYGSTSFNIVMVAVVFVMALSFLGVWEIPIPGLVGSGAATEVAAREGAVGAFTKGVLTTLLATPCSGPLLGAVFGYTLGEPPAITYLIFACIGLGMSSPYLIIGAYPRLIRFLPKPGAWMDTFKQMMGFVMLGTIVFFFSFMDRNYLVPTFAMMVGLWAGCWWIGRTSLVEPLPRKLRAWAQGSAFAAVVGVAAFHWLAPHASIIPWQNFSRAELARLTGEGYTVLVDFTADWCLNCKTNLKYAIETEEVRDLMAENKVVPLLADYTSISPEIKQMLETLRSASIPVLAVFPAGKPLDEAIVMRDLLSRQQVLDAIKAAGPSKSDGEGKSLTASTK